MDPIIQELLKEGGKVVLTTSLGACMAKLLSARKKKPLTPAEEAQVQKSAEKLVQAESMVDARRYDPGYHRLSSVAKRAAAKKAAYKKAAPKRVAVKKAASK